VGVPLVRALLDRGDEVRATDLPGTDLAALRGPGLTVRAGDLRDRALLTDLVRGVDQVVNLAALQDPSMDVDALARVDTEAPLALYREAAAAGVARFVQLGCASVYAPSRGAVDESATLDPTDEVGRCKAAVEVSLLAAAADEGPMVTVLRAAPVLGPRAVAGTAAWLALPVVLGPLAGLAPRVRGGTRASWIHAEDVAHAVLAVTVADLPRTAVFNVAAAQQPTRGEMRDAVLSGGAGDDGGLRLPAMLGTPLATLLRRERPAAVLHWLASRRFDHARRAHELPDDLQPRFDLALAARPRPPLDCGAIERLGFAPRHDDFATAWGQTLQWYRARRWLP